MEKSVISNNIASYLQISEEIKSKSNEVINDSIKYFINVVHDFIITNKIEKYGLYTFGSHAIKAMIVNQSGEILSDIDFILYIRDVDYAQLPKESTDELVKRSTEKSKVGIEFHLWTESKFTKYMRLGFFGTYRSKFICGTEISAPKEIAPTLKMTLYRSLLLLSPPDEKNLNLSYRNNLKFLKRLIEQVCHYHWPITTNYIAMLDLEPFKEKYQEEAMLFFRKESQSDFTYQECMDVFEFTKSMFINFSKEIEDLLFLEQSRDRIDPKVLSLYQFYQGLILVSYDQLDQNEFCDYIQEKVGKLLVDESRYSCKKKSKSLMLSELSSLLWSLVSDSHRQDQLAFRSELFKITLYFNKTVALGIDRNQNYKEIIQENKNICCVRMETDLPINKSAYFIELLELVEERKISLVVNVPEEIAHYFREDLKVKGCDFAQVSTCVNPHEKEELS